MGVNDARLTNDDLRHQILNTIFGWNKEVKDLIRDEMSRHLQGFARRIILANWLGCINPDIVNVNFENMASSDWMLRAVSGIGEHASPQKLCHAYVQRLLEAIDLRAAVTIMLGMGNHNDAIEVHIPHKRYMEALILSFGDSLLAGDGGRSPIAVGVTPITDSAGSPPLSHASNSEVTASFLRPSNNSRFNAHGSA
ncbi:hypothetical protein FAGAP_945 [Fusarium agapanthi]|uniref:Uncharacterized protein n=1 Tax=Fusarium agapanthi TaxID=1803897 RepID=A0A9P5EAR5_9HYPO|nr:hypothetical protein FAGAP_945 [Fusarium agapanthi]